MSTMDSLGDLVNDLVAAPAPTLVNPYACFDPNLDRPGAAAIRAATLLAYLEARSQPVLLLVGEAAGYLGLSLLGDRLHVGTLVAAVSMDVGPARGLEGTFSHHRPWRIEGAGTRGADDSVERCSVPPGRAVIALQSTAYGGRAACWDGVAAAPPRDHGAGHGGGHRSGCRGGTASWDAVSPSPSARRGW